MIRVRGISLGQVVEARVVHARRRKAESGQGTLHPGVVGRLADVYVLSLGVEQDNRHAGALRLPDKPADRCGFASARGTEHGEVAGEDGLAVMRDTDLDVFVAQHSSYPQVTKGLQSLPLVLYIEDKHGTV